MSRTYKDKPSRLIRYTRIRLYFGTEPEVTPKKKKRLDTEWHWMNTPSWWNRMFNNRPKRKKQNRQLRVLPADLEEVDIADTGNKPHAYYF